MSEAAKGAPGPRVLIFRTGGESFALEIGSVEEIVAPLPSSPVPLTPPFIGGLVNLRGKVYTLVSLTGLTSPEGVEPGGAAAAMVILRLPDMDLALGVEEITGIDRIAPREMGVIASEDASGSPVRAVFQHEGNPVSLLDVDRLTAALTAYRYQMS
jgi:chemotaxis signal transduction protein